MAIAIALIQMKLSADPDDNVSRAVAMIREAARAGAQLACLPELFRTRYFCQREDARCFDLAEPIPGPTTQVLADEARRAGLVLIVPLFERAAAGIYYNSVAVIDADGALVGRFRKMHIPDDPAYYEKFYFTPGDLGFRAFDTAAGRIGTLICWDQWFPEAARLTAMHGAGLICYPTAIGWHPAEKDVQGARQRDAWQTVQRGHAIANGVYVAAVNRVGHECPKDDDPGIEFWGTSFLADPQGMIVAQGSATEEEVVLASVDLAHLEEVRRNWPFWRDRRIDAYAGLERRFLHPDER